MNKRRGREKIKAWMSEDNLKTLIIILAVFVAQYVIELL
jgi:hypothetical protein